jgi:hypothetical protein
MSLIDARKIISSLIVCGCLVWASGCYTAMQITPASEHQGNAITVKTKDGLEYRLKEWRLLPNGDIEGKGIQVMGFQKAGKPYEGTVVANDMLIVTYDEFNATKTVLCIAVVLTLVIMVTAENPFVLFMP